MKQIIVWLFLYIGGLCMEHSMMKTKPILPLIAMMSLPAVISMMVNSLYNIIDSFFVAMISEEAFTAVSLVFPVQNFVNAVSIGFGVGLNAVISFFMGARQEDLAHTAATHGMVLSVIHGMVLMIGCIWVMPSFLRMFTANEEIISLGITYANIVFAFSVVITIDLAYEKMFQAVGRMKVSMVSLILGCLTNIMGDPILIFGWGPIPAMGITGAALATGLGQVVSLLVYLGVQRYQPLQVHISRAYLTWHVDLDKKIYSIGIPAILNMALPSILVSALNAIFAGYSTVYVVILGIYYKLQTFLYMPTNGIIQGIRPLVGYNFGAKCYDRVKKLYEVTLIINAVIMLIGMVVCLCIPHVLIGAFSDNTETIQHGATALRCVSFGFVLSAVSITSSGALEGLGKGMPSLWISLLRYIIIIIPAAYGCCYLWGPDAVWHAFWIAEAVTAICAYGIYRSACKISY